MTNQELKNKIDCLESNYLELQSQIRDLRSQLTNNLMHENTKELNVSIDRIFETVNDKTSVIIIGTCRGVCANIFEGYDKYYKKFNPAFRYFHSPYIEINDNNNWCVTEKELSSYTECAIDKFLFLISNIDYSQIIIPFINTLFENGSIEGIGEKYSGYMAITRDHKLVKFICGDNSEMLDNYIEQPTVLFDFKNIVDTNKSV